LSRRIAHDEIELGPAAPELGDVRERVGRDEVVGRGIDPVLLERALRRRVSFRGDVDRDDARCATERRCEREAARVAEQVEHAPPGADDLAHAPAVLSLIEEGSGLLPMEEIDLEDHPVLADVDGLLRLSAPQHPDLGAAVVGPLA
jgi:hypothetical protein